MSDLLNQIAESRDHLVPASTDAAGADRQWRRLKARARRRTAVRRAGAAVAVLVVAGLVPLALTSPRRAPAVAVAKTVRVERAAEPVPDLRFSDGSQVSFLTPDTEVDPRLVSDDAVELGLSLGAARFEVTPGQRRTFTVWVDDAQVSVVGTRFIVRRLGAERFRVEVEEGRVRVRSPDGDGGLADELLGPGDVHEGSTVQGAPAEDEASTSSRPVPSARAPRSPVPAVSTWRALAEEGRFEEAYSALLESDDLRTQNVGDLLLAADAARLSGHRDEAVDFLREVLQHPDDPRASLGAFTLGRVLLRVRPHEAASAFGTARRLDPESSLAQDALAREVEAWYLAGRPERAQQLALEYERQWPNGLRLGAVRRWGGLDSR